MTSRHFPTLSAAQREAAGAALTAVLGRTSVDHIAPVTGGVSGAHVFRVEASDYRYLLRIEGPPSPLRNPHQYESMRIAAEAGIAPRIHHLDETARAVVMDFVEDRGLEPFPDGSAGLAQAVGALLRQVQTLLVFPQFVDYQETVRRLWAHVRRTGLFAEGLLDPYSQRLADLHTIYAAQSGEMVSSHNDVLPRNLLFDGQRLWLIDWESAYLNDPMVDVATALDNFAPSDEVESVLLRAWLGRPLDPSELTRLTLVRSLTRLYYAGVLLSAAATAPRPTPCDDLSALTPAQFEHEVRSGRLRPETPETSLALGKMYLASFLSGEKPPGLPPMYMR